MSTSDEATTTEELAQQAADQEQEEAIAGALDEVSVEWDEGSARQDAYQDREDRRQELFNQLHGEEEADSEETGQYLDNHHAWERSESDGQGDT